MDKIKNIIIKVAIGLLAIIVYNIFYIIYNKITYEDFPKIKGKSF